MCDYVENRAVSKTGTTIVFEKIKNIFKKEIIVKTIIQAGSGISANYAGYGHSNNYGSGSKWPSGTSAGATINIHDHFSIRQQVRDKMYDSTVAHGIVERFADTIVDTGLKVKPVPIPEIIGLTPEQTEEWAEDVAGRFHLWAKSKKSQRSRVNNFYQNQHLYQKFQQRDNDIFVRFYYGRDKDLVNPLQIDFLDPNQIRGYDYTSNYAQLPGDDGIERDGAGREKAYKIWNITESGEYKDITVPAIGEKSKRIFMIHGFRPEYAGQVRGYSLLAHAIQEFENLTDFKASAIKKAIAQSSFIAAIENDQQDASNPIEGKVAGPLREYGANPQPDVNAQNVTVESIEPIINWSAMPEATIHEPGSTLVGNLRKGDKMKYLQDTSPSANYDAFVSSFCSFICASVGMPLELLLMKFNNNYSASRATLILFWRIAQIWRDEMASDFLDPVYETWLSEEIAAGRISAPGWSDVRIRQGWLSSEWAGAPLPNIDPLKTANADKEYTALGAQTLDDVARNLNGSSGKANRIKNARQFEELPPAPWNQQAESTDENKDDDDEEEKDDG